jgi:hypothetical protein
MAIIKEIEMVNGVIAEYWKVDDILITSKKKMLSITISLWKDEETRLEPGKEPISIKNFIVEIDEISGNIFEKAYEAIKQLPLFKGAENV